MATILLNGSAQETAAHSGAVSWWQTCLGTERQLVVGVAWDAATVVTSVGVTFDGVPMEAQTLVTSPGGGVESRQQFVQRDPSSGAHLVRVAFNGDDLTAPPAAPAVTGMTRLVHSGGDLQAALNAADPGDEIVLDAGATFTGNFTLPTKSPGDVITIRTSATLPPRRITPADAALLATIATANASASLTGGAGVANWRLDGIQIGPTTTGENNAVDLQGVDNITIDRMLLVGGTNGQKRGVLGNGTNITLCRSHLANCWTAGADSQAFNAFNGAGPYTLLDNYCEAASEPIMFGGADCDSADDIPSDILVEGNYCTKQFAWVGTGKNVKNLFELKCAQRVTARRNVFSGNWADAQDGTAILFTPRNQGGTAPWTVVQDVLFEQNIVRDTVRGFAIQGSDNFATSEQTTNITVRNNLIVCSDRFLFCNRGNGTIVLDHNTVNNGGTFIYLAEAPAAASFTCTNHVGEYNTFGLFGDGGFEGTAALNAFCTASVWTNNILYGGHGTYPPVTLFPDVSTYFDDYNADFTLKATSSYTTGATNGTAIGTLAWAGLPDWMAGQSLSLSQVNQTTGWRASFVSNSLFGGAPGVNVTDSVAGDLVVDTVVSQVASLTVGGGQTVQHQANDIQSAGFSSGLSTKVATGATTAMTWTGGTVWATGAQAMAAAPDPPVVIQPPAGWLAFKGPQNPNSQDRWMAAAGRLVLAGLAASVLLSVAPPAGAMTFTGLAPTPEVGPSFISTPAAGSLVWHGLTPSVLVEAPGITTGAGSLVWHGLIPDPVIVTKTIEVPAGSLVFKGPARPQEVPQPGCGSLLLTGQTPQATVAGGGTSPQINVGVGVLTWHGLAPTAFPDRSILMGVGSLVFAGQYFGVAFSPLGCGSLVWQGLIPTVQATSALVFTPGAGVLTYHGEVPTSHLDRGPVMLAGSLVFHGLAPLSGQTTSVLPDAGSLVWAGYAPVALKDVVALPGAGHLAYSAQQVTVFLETVYDLGAGTLTFVGYVAQPTITVHEDQVAAPDAGSLVLTGQAPTVTATTTTDFFPGAGSLVLAGQTPLLFINNAPQMPAGSLVFSGQAPERSEIQDIPNGRLIWQGQLVRSVNSGDASPIPPLAYGSGMFFYQSQRR